MAVNGDAVQRLTAAGGRRPDGIVPDAPQVVSSGAGEVPGPIVAAADHRALLELNRDFIPARPRPVDRSATPDDLEVTCSPP